MDRAWIDITDIVSSLGEIIASLADGAKRGVGSGFEIVDIVKARAARKELQQLTRELTHFYAEQTSIIDSLSEAYEKRSWDKFRASMSKLQEIVDRLWLIIEASRNFPLDEQGRQLIYKIYERRRILENLEHLQTNITNRKRRNVDELDDIEFNDSIESMGQLVESYDRIHRCLPKIFEALDKAIKEAESRARTNAQS